MFALLLRNVWLVFTLPLRTSQFPRMALGILMFSIVGLSAAMRDQDAIDTPRLVVVVSVDQLAYEYLDRFRANFSERGLFNRCLREGATFSECHHRHAFTITGPGHSVMMTGTYPFATGIIDNFWYDRATKKPLYCVEDVGYPIVGAEVTKAELKGVSPKNLLVPTVGDVLKKATAGRSKVFGITLKDRAAVLMTGHKADLAIWFDSNTGNWVSSRYYLKTLPPWLKAINDRRDVNAYVGQSWKLLYDQSKYKLHYPDDHEFEGMYEGLGRAFPHQLEKMPNARFYKQLPATWFGNDMTLRAAEQLVVQERLGKNNVPDILCLGLSANDYVGHNFGPHSLEVEDITYRTDVMLGEFLDFLDRQIGPGKWTLALTADHAVAPIPEYAATIGLPGERNALDTNKLQAVIETALVEKFGPPQDKTYVEKFDGQQVYLRHTDATKNAQRFDEMQILVRDILAKHPAIAVAFTRNELLASPPQGYDLINQFRRACNPERSGDVLYAKKPYHISGTARATHGSPWHYDSNVPLLFLGAGIEPGQHSRQVSPAMIAPTVAKLLKIDPPSGNIESPLDEVLKKE